MRLWNGKRAFPTLVVAWLIGWALGVPVGAQSSSDGTLDVEACVEIALEQSHRLGQSAAALKSAEGQALAQTRAILPTVTASAAWTQQHYDEPRPVVIEGVLQGESDVFYDGRMSLRASQSLLNLESYHGWRSSRARIGAAREDWIAVRQDVEVSTRQQFHECLAAIKLAEVEDNAVSVAQEQLRRAETLFNLGSVARSDVLQARVNLAEAEMNAINRHNVVRVENSRLSMVMGLDPRGEVAVDTTLTIPAEDPSGNIEEWIARAMDMRPEFAAARTRLRASRLDARGSKLGRLPVLGADFSWSRSGTSDDTYLEEAEFSSNWSLSLYASITLFNGLQREGQIQAAVADVRLKQEQLDQLEKEIALEVKDSYLTIRKERESLRASQTSVRLAEESLRLQQALYESGAGTLLEWDNARLDLRRARVSLIQARISLLLAHVRFNKAVGV